MCAVCSLTRTDPQFFPYSAQIVPHPEFDQLVTLCEASFEVPHWWIPVTHDVDLINGVSRYVAANAPPKEGVVLPFVLSSLSVGSDPPSHLGTQHHITLSPSKCTFPTPFLPTATTNHPLPTQLPMCAYVYTVCMYILLYVCIYCMYVYTVCMYIRTVCMYVCMYIRTVCMYIPCVHMYILYVCIYVL